MPLETDPIDVLTQAISQQIRSTEMLELEGRAQKGKDHHFTTVTGSSYLATAEEIREGRNAILVQPAATEIAVIVVNPKTGLAVRKASLVTPERIRRYVGEYIAKGELADFNDLLTGKVPPLELFKRIVKGEDVILDVSLLGNQALEDFRSISDSGIGAIVLNGIDIVPPNPIINPTIDQLMAKNSLPATNLIGMKTGFLFGHDRHSEFRTVGSWDGEHFSPYLTGNMQA